MMRRPLSLFLLLSLVVTGAAPLTGERLLCAMPMPASMPATGTSDVGSSCGACATDPPAAAASLEAASCCRTAPATEAETLPATVSVSSRRGGPVQSDAGPMPDALDACPALAALSVPSLDSSPPIPAASPPLLSTQTTHLRN